MTGTLFGVDAGSLSLEAADLIHRARVLAYPMDCNGASPARSAAAAHINGAHPLELPLYFPPAPQTQAQRNARRQAVFCVLHYLRAGRDVVFVTRGEPLRCGTFRQLLEELPAETPVEVMAGAGRAVIRPAAESSRWLARLPRDWPRRHRRRTPEAHKPGLHARLA